MKRKLIISSAVFLSVLFISFATAAILIYNGILLLNDPSVESFPVRGVDVSSYQGTINWDVLSSEGISFAFIKATEGSSYVDPCFEYNWSAAQTTSLRIGAYHFFSFDSEGKTQAENFIATVTECEDMLPPVIDLEFYGEKEKNPPARQDVRRELDIMISMLEEHYGKKPIIYATENSYSLYLNDAYEGYDIWIRNVVTSPTLSDGKAFTFWQYTNRERLAGYDGEERFIDMNVFSGTAEEFAEYAK